MFYPERNGLDQDQVLLVRLMIYRRYQLIINGSRDILWDRVSISLILAIFWQNSLSASNYHNQRRPPRIKIILR